MKNHTILGFEQNSLQNQPVYLPKNKIWKAVSWILLAVFAIGLSSIAFFPSE